jgi:four helix bundle protein
MWVSRIEKLEAYQLAVEFKLEVYRLVKSSPEALSDFRFRNQIRDAAAGVERCLTEGFHRKNDGEFLQFIRYALGSLAEARGHVRDGIARDYFDPAACGGVSHLGQRCEDVTDALYNTIQRRVARRKQERQTLNERSRDLERRTSAPERQATVPKRSRDSS